VRIIYWVTLAISLCGLVASLMVHIRSALGLGLSHWILPFGFIFGLFLPYLLACDDIVHGGVKLWRRRPLASIEAGSSSKSSFFLNWSQQQRWGKEAFRNRPPWIKKMDFLFLGYFFLVFAVFSLKHYSNDPDLKDFSSSALPARVAFLFSSGWMAGCWLFFGTFWHVLQLDRKGRDKR
jgi:hypothetical protein